MKMYSHYDPNTRGSKVGDCVIRSISKVMNKTWDDVYIELFVQGFFMGDIMNGNSVWGAYMVKNGFKRKVLDCDKCITVAEFAETHPNGAYVLGTGTHAVACVDGCYCDSWDSGNELPIYYYEKETD